MVMTLKVECVSGMFLEEECVRVIEIDEKSSLMDLHLIIQESVDFDNDHMFEFYAGRHIHDRRVLFTDADIWDLTPDVFCDVPLDEIFPLPPGLKLFYLFDFGDDWFFQITKSRKKPADPEPGVEYPRIIERIGPDPVQYGNFEDEDDEELDEDEGEE
jgi:hypothetical protein